MTNLSLPESFWCPKCRIHNRASHPGIPGQEANQYGLGPALKPLCPVCEDKATYKEMYSEAT